MKNGGYNSIEMMYGQSDNDLVSLLPSWPPVIIYNLLVLTMERIKNHQWAIHDEIRLHQFKIIFSFKYLSGLKCGRYGIFWGEELGGSFSCQYANSKVNQH